MWEIDIYFVEVNDWGMCRAIFQPLSAHPFIYTNSKQIQPITQSQPTQTNNQPTSSPFHCLVP